MGIGNCIKRPFLALMLLLMALAGCAQHHRPSFAG